MGVRGSSPRGRGKLSRSDFGRVACRAHPRAGGENVPAGQVTEVGDGSSPRGRGKRSKASLQTRTIGLIPARAGKTTRTSATARVDRAHPRAGGENGLLVVVLSVDYGSSPRGRGKRVQLHASEDGPRLIPARAGKTLAPTPEAPARPAHPRAGGENEEELVHGQASFGSSPRGRGKRPRRGHRRLVHRLIPARAGKT